MKAAALFLMLAAPLALGGCGKKEADPDARAAGEVLPRSVTDDMPPYDTVRSQPPLAAPEATETATTARRPAPQASAAGEEDGEAAVVPAASGE